MECEQREDILCLPGDDKNYALEISSVTEICPDIQVSKMPCLPTHYAGVCNYKGTIIPVVSLMAASHQEETENCMMLIVSCGQYQFGIPIWRPPFIINSSAAEKIENPGAFSEEELWSVREIYKKDGELYLRLDLEKTVENLIIHPV